MFINRQSRYFPLNNNVVNYNYVTCVIGTVGFRFSLSLRITSHTSSVLRNQNSDVNNPTKLLSKTNPSYINNYIKYQRVAFNWFRHQHQQNDNRGDIIDGRVFNCERKIIITYTNLDRAQSIFYLKRWFILFIYEMEYI